MTIFYIVGLQAICKKSIRLMDIFNLVCLIDMLAQMIQAYVQRFNPLAFFLRMASFLYSKFLCDQLIKIIILLF